ncbi:hypothetical protein RUM43_015053 [Polyplax serrata]|uniref:Uncharacterized protein n=1 Tax=Polyplax serrata TaxID=468196 RepID=A0AAN8PAV3_POLSC
MRSYVRRHTVARGRNRSDTPVPRYSGKTVPPGNQPRITGCDISLDSARREKANDVVKPRKNAHAQRTPLGRDTNSEGLEPPKKPECPLILMWEVANGLTL